LWKVGGTQAFVPVKIKNVKQAYGREDCYVEPVNGRGGSWVRYTSLEVERPGLERAS
jgi:hypothetical protein